jgi:hypothetical protein
MTGAFLGIPLYGWIIGGVAIASFLMNSGFSMTQPKFDQFSDPGVGVGPWTSPTTSQTAVPLLFGKVRYPLPLLHYRLDGDQFRNMWLIFAVGEDWRTLSGGEYENIIHNLWINDYEIKEMEEYTEDPDLFDSEHSWYKFFPSGVGISFDWNVSGKHVFTKPAEPGGVAETYALLCTHDANQGNGPVHLTVRTIHEWPEGGARQSWRIRVSYLEEVDGEGEYSSDLNKHFFDATQTVEAGKDSETYHVPGTEARTFEMDLPYRGKFKVVLENESGQIDTTDPLYGTDPPVKPDKDDYPRELVYDDSDHGYHYEIDPSYYTDLAVWREEYAAWEEANTPLEEEALGTMYLDSVVINDPGGALESHSFNGTSCLLVRIIDNTGELARPTVTGLVEGGPSNPAEALEWILGNDEIGMALPDEHIDRGAMSDVKDAMEAYGYTYNRAICERSTYESVIQDICSCGRIILAEWNGMYTPFLDEEVPEAEIQEINLDDQAVKDSLSYSQKSLQKIPNSFNIKYVDADIEYTLQDILTDDTELQDIVGAVNKQEIPLLGVTTMQRAWELGWYQIKYAQSDMTMSFQAMPSIWGMIYPGFVFRARSARDPLIDNTDWLVVGVEESEPGTYSVQATQYVRSAYNPTTLNKWGPDVWIPGGSLGTTEDTPSESPYGMTISHVVGEDSTPGNVRISFYLHNRPANARRVRIYRSYTGYLEGTASVSGYQHIGDFETGQNSHVVVERTRYSAIHYRFPVVDSKGRESPLESAPIAVVYPFTSLDDLPGFGIGDYGVTYYGG